MNTLTEGKSVSVEMMVKERLVTSTVLGVRARGTPSSFFMHRVLSHKKKSMYPEVSPEGIEVLVFKET